MTDNGRTGLFVGLKKGQKATVAPKYWKKTPVTRKGNISNRCRHVREVIREVAGFSNLEKKMLELVRTGVASKEKKAVKTARAKLGTHKRAKIMKNDADNIIQASRRK